MINFFWLKLSGSLAVNVFGGNWEHSDSDNYESRPIQFLTRRLISVSIEYWKVWVKRVMLLAASRAPPRPYQVFTVAITPSRPRRWRQPPEISWGWWQRRTSQTDGQCPLEICLKCEQLVTAGSWQLGCDCNSWNKWSGSSGSWHAQGSCSPLMSALINTLKSLVEAALNRVLILFL